MIIALMTGLLTIILIVLVFFSKVKFELEICINHVEAKTNFTIKILYGLITFKRNTSIKYLSEKEEKNGENSSDYFSFIKENKDSIQDTLSLISKEVKMSKFHWTTVVGLGEATSTCVLSGVVWSIKSVAIQLINKYIEFKCKPNIDVKPNVQQYAFQTNLQCMSDMRAGKAMVVGIKMHKEWQNIRREMDSHQLNRRTAHV